MGDDKSKDNIATLDNPIDGPPFDCPRASHNIEKEAVKSLEMVVNSHIECKVDWSNKGAKDDLILCEEGTSKPTPSAKKKKSSKSKKKKENPKDGSIVCEEGTSKPAPNAKKKTRSKSKKKKESNDNNTKNGVNFVSVKEAFELKPPLKKKSQRMKGSLAHSSNEPLKRDTTSQKDEAQTTDGAHWKRKESEGDTN